MRDMIVPLAIVIAVCCAVVAGILTLMSKPGALPGSNNAPAVVVTDRMTELSRQLAQELRAKDALQTELSQLRWSKEQLQRKMDELQEENCKLREEFREAGIPVPERQDVPTPPQTPPQRMHAMEEAPNGPTHD